MVVEVRGQDDRYERQAVSRPNRREPPPEDSTAWILTLPRTTKELVDVLVDKGFDNVRNLIQLVRVTFSAIALYA